MDGDSLGKQMSDPDKQLAISESLNAFTNEVEDIVKSHSGFLIYAGGDDVLALLPMEKAIECAQSIRTAYDQCIEIHGKACGLFSSISGAIQFAHFKTPFTKILHDAHSLLDDVAKDQTGRDALAVRVWKPGGLHLEWAQPWKHILDGDKNALLELVSLFADQKNGSKFSNGFIQRINELSDRLGMEQQPLSEDVFKGLMQAELVRSGIEIYGTHKNLSRDFDETKQNELIDRLVLLSRPYLRTVNESTSGMPEVVIKATNKVFSKDGPKLVRFLATKGLMEQGGDL
jgi:CRISPR-associated protein Cmr2